MRFEEFRDRIERDLEFPADRRTVIGTLGGFELEAPDGGSETIEEILGRTARDGYRSADEVYTDVFGYVSADYIGRRYYDDRGANVSVDHRSF